MELASAAYVAKQLGIRPSAVGNWLRRGVLPDELMPRYEVDHGTVYPTPLWDKRQVPQIIKWYEGRHHGTASAARGR